MSSTIKSLEYTDVFAALLCDVQTLHCDVFTTSDLRKTLNKVDRRISSEGLGFLTKTLPRLGKGLDKTLAGSGTLCATSYGFKPMPGGQLPIFLGELFSKVLTMDGAVLPNANVACVQALRDLLFSFYKLEVPYDPKLEQNVIDRFVKTEDEVQLYSQYFNRKVEAIARNSRAAELGDGKYVPIWDNEPTWFRTTVHEAIKCLGRLFDGFDPVDIYPRHGPGAVSTKETLEGKYRWTKVNDRIRQIWPLDAYYFASCGHVCDCLSEISTLSSEESYAKVTLVPKDSRGPRLISMEPLENQWIQQGLARSIVQLVERHPLTRESVRFTDQEPNRNVALLASRDGRYATLDLNEASDRVSLGLVRLLFPVRLVEALEAARSLGTRLPDGRVILLHKYAPMGSALCFPVLSLITWVLLRSGMLALGVDPYFIERIYVYGDDVVVPTAIAEHAMIILESFGLKINRDKSCSKGNFRESCGMDAFKGVCVTPIRFRSVWTRLPSPESYLSWMAYANQLWGRKYKKTYDLVVGALCRTYGHGIPTRDLGLTVPPSDENPTWKDLVPSLPQVPETYAAPRWRVSVPYQRKQYRVIIARPVKVKREMNGWKMLLRHFAESCSSDHTSRLHTERVERTPEDVLNTRQPFSVSVYTKRNCSKLQRSWR